ncbi:MAG: toll/interleukin-1 receptor domain-containing protein [Cyanobacteria bacterium P01_C01_bin.118]
MTSFFISYNRADKAIAEWIAWILEEEQHSVIIQAWDFRPGGNFILDMQRAATDTDKTIIVLSDAYLKAEYTQPEWAAAFANDPESKTRKLLPIRVGDCRPTGMLRLIVYVDLVGLEEEAARQAVLAALEERVKPVTKPTFPLVGKERTVSERPDFPGRGIVGEEAASSGPQPPMLGALSLIPLSKHLAVIKLMYRWGRSGLSSPNPSCTWGPRLPHTHRQDLY